MSSRVQSLSAQPVVDEGLWIPVVPKAQVTFDKARQRLLRNWQVVSRREIYYPYYFSDWKVRYRSIFGRKELKKRLAGDMHRCLPGFADTLPETSLVKVDCQALVESAQTPEEAMEQAREMLRKHVIHQLRSWTVPEIEVIDGLTIHVGYEVWELRANSGNRSKTLLLEMATGSMAKLEEFPHLETFVNKHKRGKTK